MEDNLAAWRADPENWIKTHLRVKSKEGGIAVPMTGDFAPSQEKLVRLVAEIRGQGKPVRLVALKPRQVGATTISAALIYHATVLWPNQQSQIVSMDLESAQQIHEKNDLFYELSSPLARPMRARSSRREMLFANPKRHERATRPGLRSRIFVESAKKATIGRSMTIHHFLGSEVGYWKDGEERAVAAMNAVPELPQTTVILESTANGVGNFFHKMYELAKSGTSDWRAWFFAWFEHPEYRRAPDHQYDAKNLDAEEVTLQQAFNLDDEQITWRRWSIAEKFHGDSTKFKQEYPATDDEAFLLSGRHAFPLDQLSAYERTVERPQPMRVWVKSDGRISAESRAQSSLHVWRPPVPGRQYVIGADSASGIETGDFQAAEVIDLGSRQQVAEYRSTVDTGDFAGELFRLGIWYNTALLAVEKSMDGVNVLAHLAHAYPNLYTQEVWDEVGQKVTKKVGWVTDQNSKRLILNELKNAIRWGQLTVRSRMLLEELKTMQRDELGRFGAAEGKHDDLVMAFAISWWVARQHATIVGYVESNPMQDSITVREPLHDRIRRYRLQDEEDLRPTSL